MVIEHTVWDILIDEIAVHFDCTLDECDKGISGARWKTPALEPQFAVQMLNMHSANTYGH